MNSKQKAEEKKLRQQEFFEKGQKVKEDKNNKLCPRCIFKNQEINLSSEGYFTPCCWLDDELYRNQPYVSNFFKTHLSIDNNENVQDIFDSNEWQEFWNILLYQPESAPPVCYEYCATELGNIEITDYNKEYKSAVVKKH